MTVNDYLARRDAAWMGGIYRFLGLSVALRAAGHDAGRTAGRLSPLTSRTPPQNEIGFDFLRDRLAMRSTSRSTARSHAAVIDEADSILIDEARVPLVIAGGDSGDRGLAYVADQVVRGSAPGEHFTIDAGAHNVALTDAGIRAVEDALGCGNLFDERQPAAPHRGRRTRCTRMPCCAATSTTSSRTAPSRWWTSSRAGSRRTAAGPPDCTPPSKPRRAWRPSRRA